MRPTPPRIRRALTAALLAAATALAVDAAGTPPAASLDAAAGPSCPWVGSTAPIPQRVGQVLARMTVAQEVSLATGAGGSSYVGLTPAIGALCIPALNLEDGPAGVAGGMTRVTQLPRPVDV